MIYNIVFIFVAMLSSPALAAGHFWRGTTIGLSEVGKRWGTGEFDATQFKSGGEKLRSTMAHAILKSKKVFVGTHVLDLRKQLGDPDGFYFTDVVPAYLIQRAKADGQESWQIVFLLNKQRTVEDIIVHKNCCD